MILRLRRRNLDFLESNRIIHSIWFVMVVVLNIHFAENVRMMIITTASLCFKGFSRLSSKFLGVLAASFYGRLAAKSGFSRLEVGLL